VLDHSAERALGGAADEDRRVRALGGDRVALEAGPLHEVAVVGDLVAGPDGLHRGEVVVEPGAAPLERGAAGVELLAHPADAPPLSANVLETRALRTIIVQGDQGIERA